MMFRFPHLCLAVEPRGNPSTRSIATQLSMHREDSKSDQWQCLYLIKNLWVKEWTSPQRHFMYLVGKTSGPDARGGVQYDRSNHCSEEKGCNARDRMEWKFFLMNIWVVSIYDLIPIVAFCSFTGCTWVRIYIYITHNRRRKRTLLPRVSNRCGL